MKKLALPLLELDGQHRFNTVLFDCLDMGQFDIAWYLVDAGFPWDISKQVGVVLVFYLCGSDIVTSNSRTLF